MKSIYHFSPIKDEKGFEEVLSYLVEELDKLANKLFGRSLPITTLKVFPHYQEEYEYLYDLLSKLGSKASFSSDTSLYVQVNKQIKECGIKYLGVRIVDPYRMQVGCGDYEIENFEEFKKQYLGTSPFIRSFRDDMLELWHPDFDVLGYIVPVL